MTDKTTAELGELLQYILRAKFYLGKAEKMIRKKLKEENESSDTWAL